MARAVSWISCLALGLIVLPANAAAPYEVLGYRLGQPMQQALALNTTRAAKPCGDRQCLTFDANYLGRAATISLELDKVEGVRRIAFNISTDKQPDHPDCAKLGGSVVAAIATLYGRFNESDPGATYTWLGGEQKLKIYAVCVTANSGTITGLYQKVGATAH